MNATVGSLFSGIGGMDLGLERAGWEVRWQSEIDSYCSRVLAKHWPGVPNLGDVTKIEWEGVERVDLICGGFPCQPVSVAGRRRAQADERWLWPEFTRCLRLLQPRYIVVENVPGLRSRGLDIVLGDLASLGYDAEWDRFYASWLGANHRRSRLIIVAYPGGFDLREQQGRGRWSDRQDPILTPEDGRDGDMGRRHFPLPWLPQPDVARSVHGVPSRMDRARWRALGNAVVPQVAEFVGSQLLASLSGGLRD